MMIKSQCIGFLNTSELWEKIQFDIQQFEFPSLEFHSFKPTPLPSNIRLGHQIEYVFKQLVEYSDMYEVLLYNLPIRDEQRTLGEIDFILKDNAKDKLIHVELTYKFYIIDPSIVAPIERLIGPNRRDSFLQKMEKIKNVQFPLLHSVAGTKALANFNIDHLVVEHQCCFKAQLFQPYGISDIDIGPLNKNCISGYWLGFDEFQRTEFSNSQFYVPSKSEWPIQPHLNVLWRTYLDVLNDININMIEERSLLIWQRNASDQLQKFFVVWW